MRLPWQEAASLGTPAAIGLEGSISQHTSSAHLLESEDPLYEITDSGINHNPERLAEPHEGLRLRTRQLSEVKPVSFFF